MTDQTVLFSPMRPLRRASSLSASRRTSTWVTVVVIHVLMLSIFLVSERFPVFGHSPPLETMLLLPTRPGASKDQAAPLVTPKLPDEGAPEVVPMPITVPPPVLRTPPAADSTAPSASEILGNIGQSLGCGAGGFEHLTQFERSQCRRPGWYGRKLSGGTIVLDAPMKLPEPQADQTQHISGADALRRRGETSDPCPILLNVPCLNGFVENRN